MSDELAEIVCVTCRTPLGQVVVQPGGATLDWAFCSWVCVEKAVEESKK